MSRGRKPKSNDTNLSWQQIFSKNVGNYLQIISIELCKTQVKQEENVLELLKKIESERAQLLSNRKLRLNNANPKSQIVKLRYEIPKNWNWFLLSDVAFYQEGPGIRTFQYRDEGIKLLNVQNITQDKLRLDLTTRHISIEEYEEKYKHFKIEEGDILFASSGGSWGKTCWFESSDKDLILNTSTMRIKTFSEKILLNKYLYLFIKTNFFRNQLIPQLMGMQPNFGSTHFNSVSIAVPPILEQERILEFLNDFENNNLKEDGYYFNQEVEQKVIALHESQLKGFEIANELTHQLALVKNLRQQLLQDAVQGKLVKTTEGGESAHDLLKRIKAEKEQLIKDKKLKKEKELPPIKAEEIPFEIPDDWVWCRLGDLCIELLGGFAFDSTRYSKTETSNQVIRLGNVKPNQLVLETGPVFIDDDYAVESMKSKLQLDDILITMTGTRAKQDYLFTLCLGENDLITKNLFLNQRVGCFRFGKFISNHFINILLKDRRLIEPVFLSSTGAANQANIGIAALKDILIPLPPLSIQHRIVEKVESLMSLCAALETSIGASVRENEALLQQVLWEALQG